jgi:hypothetical protein
MKISKVCLLFLVTVSLVVKAGEVVTISNASDSTARFTLPQKFAEMSGTIADLSGDLDINYVPLSSHYFAQLHRYQDIFRSQLLFDLKDYNQELSNTTLRTLQSRPEYVTLMALIKKKINEPGHNPTQLLELINFLNIPVLLYVGSEALADGFFSREQLAWVVQRNSPEFEGLTQQIKTELNIITMSQNDSTKVRALNRAKNLFQDAAVMMAPLESSDLETNIVRSYFAKHPERIDRLFPSFVYFATYPLDAGGIAFLARAPGVRFITFTASGRPENSSSIFCLLNGHLFEIRDGTLNKTLKNIQALAVSEAAQKIVTIESECVEATGKTSVNMVVRDLNNSKTIINTWPITASVDNSYLLSFNAKGTQVIVGITTENPDLTISSTVSIYDVAHAAPDNLHYQYRVAAKITGFAVSQQRDWLVLALQEQVGAIDSTIYSIDFSDFQRVQINDHFITATDITNSLIPDISALALSSDDTLLAIAAGKRGDVDIFAIQSDRSTRYLKSVECRSAGAVTVDIDIEQLVFNRDHSVLLARVKDNKGKTKKDQNKVYVISTSAQTVGSNVSEILTASDLDTDIYSLAVDRNNDIAVGLLNKIIIWNSTSALRNFMQGYTITLEQAQIIVAVYEGILDPKYVPAHLQTSFKALPPDLQQVLLNFAARPRP